MASAVAAAISSPPAELDAITLRRAQRGDAAAWRALIECYQGRVVAYLGRVLGLARRDRVDDVAQDTFLHVVRALPRFAPTGPARLSTWILTIATRRALDALRAGARQPAGGDPAALDAVIDPRAGVARRAGLAAAIDAAMQALPAEHRAAFVLHELHGLDDDEVARALEIAPGTVRTRLHRARAALRVALAQELNDD